jgi:hypothetical protein
MPLQKLVSDAKGIMTVPHAAAKPAWLEINTPGYQYDRLTYSSNPADKLISN